MRSVTLFIITVWILMAAAPLQAEGIALEDLSTGEKPPSMTLSPYDTFNWNYVYKYKSASASAVDHYWILTAGHVADDGGTGTLVIDGQTYIQQEVVLHSRAADPDGNKTADLALVRYDKPFPGYYLLHDAAPVGSDVVICGYGYRGDVVSTSSQSYFTQDSTGGNTTRRWGTNRINSEETYTSTTPIAATSKCFDISISKSWDNKTLYEAGCNYFDSGGGMFCKDGGEWKLAGHIVALYSIVGQPEGQLRGNYAVATKYYINWIKSVIVDYDTDMDGLPDWWETKYAGDPISMERDGHDDNDTMTNYEEWLADTIPIDGESLLEITIYDSDGTLGFNSSTNRQYQVQSRTSLSGSNTVWQIEVDWFTPTGPLTEVSVSSAAAQQYHRIRARLR